MSAKMEQLYILRLTCNKWFIGKSKDVPHTCAYYDCGFGPQWIRTYNVIEVSEVRPLKGEHDVRDTTLKWMKMYGLENVRNVGCDGMKLEDDEEMAIRFMMHAPPDACVKCHATGHTHEDCKHEKNISWACQWCVSDYPNRYACEQHEKGCRPPPPELPPPKNWCSRCGRTEHVAARCFEVKHAEGWWIR